jgi:hypothetical protein
MSGGPDPDGRLAFFDVAVELFLSGPVARDVRRLGILLRDQKRVPIRVVVEATLDVESLLKLRAGLGVADARDNLVDPCFDGGFHLVPPGVGLQGRNRESLVVDIFSPN